jgi:hypothetical protein
LNSMEFWYSFLGNVKHILRGSPWTHPEIYKCNSKESTFVEFCVDGVGFKWWKSYFTDSVGLARGSNADPSTLYHYAIDLLKDKRWTTVSIIRDLLHTSRLWSSLNFFKTVDHRCKYQRANRNAIFYSFLTGSSWTVQYDKLFHRFWDETFLAKFRNKCVQNNPL